MNTDLTDADYTLTEGRAWFTVKQFSIRILSTDEGVVVDIYKLGEEMEPPIAVTYALDHEAKEQA
jgi:hypothetical protein